MNCLADGTALLTTSTSGRLALLLSHPPHTWDEWAGAVAIFSGLVGDGLAASLIYLAGNALYQRIVEGGTVKEGE